MRRAKPARPPRSSPAERKPGGESGRFGPPARAAFAVALCLGLIWLVVPRATASDSRVAAARLIAESQPGRHNKLVAIEALVKLDSSESRRALKELAESEDDSTALCAISALAREDFSGAETKLKSIFEDEDRSDLVRGAALGGALRIAKKDERGWSSVRSWVAEHTEDGDDLDDVAQALRGKLWSTTTTTTQEGR